MASVERRTLDCSSRVEKVAGFCPMGCGQTLVTKSDGGQAHVVCGWSRCPDPTIADRILTDPLSHEHVVRLTRTHFELTHPLRCRHEAMTDCSLHSYLSELDGPPEGPGRYITRQEGSGAWSFEELPS